MTKTGFTAALAALFLISGGGAAVSESAPQLGPRPLFLVDDMREGELKSALQQCEAGPFSRSDFSIAHRGAPLVYPEHTRQSYMAAWRMGAGIIECDVTFTSDRELVCRHSQCDLHRTTDILAHPDLAAQCTQPFVPADPASGQPAQARCCASDITLAEFRRLTGKPDTANPAATTPEDYMAATPDWLHAPRGELMTHAESITLFRELGVRMTPELKEPEVAMPFDGDYSQEDYARAMIEDYNAAGVPPEDVFPQSFSLADVEFWIREYPEFGRQAVFLDGRYSAPGFHHARPQTWSPSMAELAERGVRIIAPPLYKLVREGEDGRPAPSVYAEEARAAGLDIIAWTLERSGSLATGGGFYYQTISNITTREGDVYEMLDVLARDVGVIGVFSDWPATTTYYASCMGLP